ncbi:MAG: signal peptidase I [Eubacteriales bacterium]|nr:signal peptidase I [Eubacteriales bacterium]
MKKASKALSVAASVILWIVILLAALFAFTTLATKDVSNVSSIAGYTPLSVVTDSMKPTFNAGDLIIIKKTDPSKLEEGDIITFHTIIENEYSLNTHRIAEIIDNNSFRSYVTKGDNNQIEDQHIISDGDIVGKYVAKLPKVGRVMDFLNSSIGFLVVIVLPMLIFFIYQVYHLIMVGISLKKAMAIEAAEEAARAAAVVTAQAHAASVSADTTQATMSASSAETKDIGAAADVTAQAAQSSAGTTQEVSDSAGNEIGNAASAEALSETEKLRRELEEARRKAEEAERRLNEMQNLDKNF